MKSLSSLTAIIFILALGLFACRLLPAARDPAPPAPSTATAGRDGQTPAQKVSWQWQLSGAIDTSIPADFYDIDLFDVDEMTVRQLKTGGRTVVCYLSAGSVEDWRPDASDFPQAVIGKNYAGWPGEKWLDIRRIELLAPVLRARLDTCAAKGFDGVEPDNIDGYTNDTGFPLTYADQLAFNRWLAEEAHARGLSIGLKNNPEQVPELVDLYDWALVEECFAEGWCEELLPFIDAGKPVYAAEYVESGMSTEDFCPEAAALGISAILKHLELDAYREECP